MWMNNPNKPHPNNVGRASLAFRQIGESGGAGAALTLK